eukprot:4206550-Prymnesium_polylepis.1
MGIPTPPIGGHASTGRSRGRAHLAGHVHVERQRAVVHKLRRLRADHARVEHRGGKVRRVGVVGGERHVPRNVQVPPGGGDGQVHPDGAPLVGGDARAVTQLPRPRAHQREPGVR